MRECGDGAGRGGGRGLARARSAASGGAAPPEKYSDRQTDRQIDIHPQRRDFRAAAAAEGKAPTHTRTRLRPDGEASTGPRSPRRRRPRASSAAPARAGRQNWACAPFSSKGGGSEKSNQSLCTGCVFYAYIYIYIYTIISLIETAALERWQSTQSMSMVCLLIDSHRRFTYFEKEVRAQREETRGKRMLAKSPRTGAELACFASPAAGPSLPLHGGLEEVHPLRNYRASSK